MEKKFRAFDDGKMIYESDIPHLSLIDEPILRLAKFFCNIRPDSKLTQFTGLHDKNGVEIYEGDILKCFHEGDAVGNLDQITFQQGAFFLRYRYRTAHSWIEWDGCFEVIGNIYQNPDLLPSNLAIDKNK